jgi:hypothetical protein
MGVSAASLAAHSGVPDYDVNKRIAWKGAEFTVIEAFQKVAPSKQ